MLYGDQNEKEGFWRNVTHRGYSGETLEKEQKHSIFNPYSHSIVHYAYESP